MVDDVHLVIIGLSQQKKILKVCQVFIASKIEQFHGIIDDIDMFMKQLSLRDIRYEVYLKGMIQEWIL